MTMYRVTKVFLTDENGKRKGICKTVEVSDLEKYRKSLEEKEHKKVNFVYETINED
jgi:hypothetical protein